MKKQEQISSFYFMTILIFVVVVAFQCLSYYLILNCNSMKVYPEDLGLNIEPEKYYTIIFYVINFLTLLMSGWGITSSFAAAKSSGKIRSYISYLFSLVHFVALIIIIASMYLAFTDLEGLRDLILQYLKFLPVK